MEVETVLKPLFKDDRCSFKSGIAYARLKPGIGMDVKGVVEPLILEL